MNPIGLPHTVRIEVFNLNKAARVLRCLQRLGYELTPMYEDVALNGTHFKGDPREFHRRVHWMYIWGPDHDSPGFDWDGKYEDPAGPMRRRIPVDPQGRILIDTTIGWLEAFTKLHRPETVTRQYQLCFEVTYSDGQLPSTKEIQIAAHKAIDLEPHQIRCLNTPILNTPLF